MDLIATYGPQGVTASMTYRQNVFAANAAEEHIDRFGHHLTALAAAAPV